MKKYHSIFNDVLGPIMTGPSSSHTAGCARIGKMIRILYGNDIEEAEIIFEKMVLIPVLTKVKEQIMVLLEDF